MMMTTLGNKVKRKKIHVFEQQYLFLNLDFSFPYKNIFNQPQKLGNLINSEITINPCEERIPPSIRLFIRSFICS